MSATNAASLQRTIGVRSRAKEVWSRLPLVVRYGLAAGVTQVIYLVVLALGLLVGVHYLLGMLAAQVAAIAYAFPVYRVQVFSSHGSLGRQFLAFIGVWWTGAAMSFLGVPFMVEVLGLPPFVSQFLVLAVVAVGSFLAHRRVTFASRHEPSEPRVSTSTP